ncbi:MAG: acetylglutamate kinase [Alicyclobacillaceae bacterium]|nr:acetylglutamate kinase [Alicyclobacillaceae bacterium]
MKPALMDTLNGIAKRPPLRRVAVLKIGGSLGDGSLEAALFAVRQAQAQGRGVVVVHGGGPRITAALREEGIESQFVNGQRVTSAAAMAVVERVLASVNAEIVGWLQARGVNAAGITGRLGVIRAQPIPGLERTARVNGVDPGRLEALLDAGQLPVLAPVAVGDGGLTYNVNADIAAAAVAGALGAERIVFVTDVPGIYADWEAKLRIDDATPAELAALRADGRVTAGMIPKVEAVEAAIQAGVKAAFVVDGRDFDAMAWAVESPADGDLPVYRGTRVRPQVAPEPTAAAGNGAADHLMPNYGVRTRDIVRGEGVWLYDSEGREYLDFTAGIAVCSLGHAHPALTEAIQRQAARLLHCSNLFGIPQQRELAAKLAHLSGLDRVFFCNSGAEANEAAIKLARKFAAVRGEEKRCEVVSLPGGFHGRTLGALSITPKPAYQAGFGPLLPGCVTADDVEGVMDCLSERTAACFVEIIQGEGGVCQVPPELLRRLEQRCREVGALLVIDEVQTGVGRTGTFFAFEQVGLKPDIVTMAKGLAGGVPIGAVLAREEVALAFAPGSHGSTFGGNPLATAAANVVVDVVSDPAFLAHVREVGAHLGEILRTLGRDVSGQGLMWGMTVSDAKAYVAEAAERGVLLTTAGESRVRFVPPLIVQREHVDELARRLQGIRT